MTAEEFKDIDLELNLDDIGQDQPIEYKSLEELIKGHLYECYDYKKVSYYTKDYPNADINEYRKKDCGRTITGLALFNNEVEEPAIVDFDIEHNIDEAKIRSIHNSILLKLPADSLSKDIIEETGNHGLHIYCINDIPERFWKNRHTKLLVTDDYDIDIFVASKTSSASQVMTAGSLTKNENESIIRQYKFIRGDEKRLVYRRLSEMMLWFNIPYPELIKEVMKASKDNQNSELRHIAKDSYEIDEAIEETIIQNIKHLGESMQSEINKEIITNKISSKKMSSHIIHRTIAGKYKDRMSVLPLIQSIMSYSIGNRLKLARKIVKYLPFTDNASRVFSAVFHRNMDNVMSPYILINMFNRYCPDLTALAHENIKSKIKMKTPIIESDIDFHDDFYANSIIKKYERGLYFNYNQVLNDLLRIYRVIDGAPKYALKKCYDTKDEVYVLEIYKEESFDAELKRMRVIKQIEDKGKGEPKIRFITAYDVYIENQSYFLKRGLSFNSKKIDVHNIFHGWKWTNDLDHFNYDKIALWLESTYENICHSNDSKFNYIIRWAANIAQHPGILNKICIILKGDKGVGKNTFTDVIAGIFTGYSEANLNDLQELTGDFNGGLENKVFACFNEIKNEGGRGKIKAFITEKKVRVNRKFMQAKTTENVTNLIFNTNEIMPFTLETGDRRAVVYVASAKNKSNMEYWNKLYNHIDEEFFNQLLTFLMNIDLSNYCPWDIPEDASRDKIDLQQASANIYDKFIMSNYEAFIKRVTFKELKDMLSIFNVRELEERTLKTPIDIHKLTEHFKTHGIQYKTIKLDDDGRKGYKITDEKYARQYKPRDLFEEENSLENSDPFESSSSLYDHVKDLAISLMKK